MQYVYGGKLPLRNGLNHPTIAPYGSYPASDGKEVLLSIQNEREWEAFCEVVLRQPEVAADPRFRGNAQRVAHRAELDEIIVPALRRHERDALVEMLREARVAYGRVTTMEDLASHPQNRFVEVDTPSGPVRLLGPGAEVDGEVPDFGPVPALGAHTEAVRREFAEGRARRA